MDGGRPAHDVDAVVPHAKHYVAVVLDGGVGVQPELKQFGQHYFEGKGNEEVLPSGMRTECDTMNGSSTVLTLCYPFSCSKTVELPFICSVKLCTLVTVSR